MVFEVVFERAPYLSRTYMSMRYFPAGIFKPSKRLCPDEDKSVVAPVLRSVTVKMC